MRNKVSVIVPVYNAEKNLSRCIESLLDQTLEQCEFIFINDGSKDNSKYIIKKYKNRDERVKLINQDNKGVSIARNKGMQIANGEYVGFVDADDDIERDMFETLYNTAKDFDCDIVFSNIEIDINGNKVLTTYPFPMDVTLDQEFVAENIFPYFLMNNNLNTVVNKIYKSHMVQENNICFPESTSLGEDGIFNIEIFSHAKKIKYINYTGYHYREVDGSATRNISEKDYFTRALEVYKTSLPEAFKDKVDKKRAELLKSIKLINEVVSLIHVYFTPSKEVGFWERYQYVKYMIHNEFVENALPKYLNQNYDTLGRYEKVFIEMIRKKLTLGLYAAATYSRLRNN